MDFDQECLEFSVALGVAADWKNSFSGASYRTRLEQAIQVARGACARMEEAIATDRTPTPNTDSQP